LLERLTLAEVEAALDVVNAFRDRPGERCGSMSPLTSPAPAAADHRAFS
jgi:hypothetical protein